MSEVAISVENVSKSFKLPHEKQSSIKGAFVNMFKGTKSYEKQQVLDNISFEIKKGEFFGIVGRNGSGKSTLLKLLAGIYTPDEGNIAVNGMLTPFIELGVGFNPELTGRENVFLNGALLGFNRQEMNLMYADIVKFAELRKFMDQKLKNYSSGMQVRLAFSIAIKADSPILLLDEVLAVGDQAFQKKCYNYFSELKRKGRTVVLVSHDMGAVQKFCTKALLIEKGKIVKSGDSSEIALLYSDLFSAKQQKEIVDDNKKRLDGLKNGNLEIMNVATRQAGKKINTIKAYKDFQLEICIKSQITYPKVTLGINLINSQGNIMLAVNTKIKSSSVVLTKGNNIFSFNIENIYTDDMYLVNIAVSDESNDTDLLIQKADVYRFNIVGVKNAKHSLTHPKINFELIHENKK